MTFTVTTTNEIHVLPPLNCQQYIKSTLKLFFAHFNHWQDNVSKQQFKTGFLTYTASLLSYFNRLWNYMVITWL